jgi:hypothetical protein
MGLWSALEVMVEDMLVAFLMNDSEILKNEAFSKIRLPLSEFKMLEKEERMRFLINEFERNQGTNRKHGVDMFEILFEPFGLGGTVKPEVKKNMREMHHVRNVLVHRGDKADRRIVEGCPWLGLRVGDIVAVRHEQFGRYMHALIEYVLELLDRLDHKFGYDSRADNLDENKASAH